MPNQVQSNKLSYNRPRYLNFHRHKVLLVLHLSLDNLKRIKRAQQTNYIKILKLFLHIQLDIRCYHYQIHRHKFLILKHTHLHTQLHSFQLQRLYINIRFLVNKDLNIHPLKHYFHRHNSQCTKEELYLKRHFHIILYNLREY